MRFLLDAHVSGRAVAPALRERGHDVRAVDEDRQLDGWDDDAVLELATAENRVLVTFDVRDFSRIVGEWSAAGRHHAGCLLIIGIDHSEFGLTLRVIERAIRTRPAQEDWRDYAVWGTRASGESAAG